MKTNRNPWDVPPSRDVTLRVWHHFSWFQSKHVEFLMLVASCWFSNIPSGYDWHSYWKCPIYSGFTHWTWWFSIVMLVYQRVLFPAVNHESRLYIRKSPSCLMGQDKKKHTCWIIPSWHQDTLGTFSAECSCWKEKQLNLPRPSKYIIKKHVKSPKAMVIWRYMCPFSSFF